MENEDGQGENFANNGGEALNLDGDFNDSDVGNDERMRAANKDEEGKAGGGSGGAPNGGAQTTPLAQHHRVWYEWCAKVQRGGEILDVSPIHNPNGRSYHVSM